MENALQTITEALENAEVQGWRGKIFDYTLPIPEPEPLLTCGGETIVSRGNLTILTGAPKCCKSTLLATMTAVCVKGGESLNLKSSRPLRCVYADTEQGLFHLRYQVSRIFRLAEMGMQSTDNIIVLTLRECSVEERCEYVRTAVEELKPDVLFLDGMADLVHDSNDLMESEGLISNLLALSSELNIGIVTVIHTTPSGIKVRGHLGSSAQRKAETVILLHRDGMGSEIEVSPMECRNRPFRKFTCLIEDNGDLRYVSPENRPKTCQDWLLYLMEPHIEYQNCTLVEMLKEKGFKKSTVQEALEKAVIKGSITKNDTKYTVALWENDDEDDNEDDEEN